MKRIAASLAIILCLYVAPDASGRDSAPSDAVLVKQTIVEVLDAAQKGGSPDKLKNAIQPLLFLLARRTDPATDRVLIDLSTYNLGEANSALYHCILSRRGASLAKKLHSQSLKNDCRVELGASSVLCLSDAQRADTATVILQSINRKVPCELEY